MNYNELHLGKNIEFLISISKHKKFEIAEMLGISRQQKIILLILTLLINLIKLQSNYLQQAYSKV